MKVILFDLDDTLFDHRHSRRCGLKALQAMHPGLMTVPLEELEKEHEKQLQTNYNKTLDGQLSVADARLERIRLLSLQYGLHLDLENAKRAVDHYRNIYEANRRAVAGAKSLLQHLRGRVKTGVITNGFVAAQRDKLRVCGLENLLTFVLISEEVGVKKPDMTIFEEALRRADVRPEEAIFVGDSWTSDIIGAHRCGMKTVWFNRYGFSCPDSTITTEITSFEPIEKILTLLLQPDST